MGTGSFPGVKYGRGMLLTTHPLPVPWSWKSRAIPLPTLWATTGPITGKLYLYMTCQRRNHVCFSSLKMLAMCPSITHVPTWQITLSQKSKPQYKCWLLWKPHTVYNFSIALTHAPDCLAKSCTDISHWPALSICKTGSLHTNCCRSGHDDMITIQIGKVPEYNSYHCTVHSNVCRVHLTTNALLLTL